MCTSNIAGRVQGSSCGDDKRDTGKEFSVAAASGKPSNSVLLNGKGKVQYVSFIVFHIVEIYTP